MKSKSVLHWLFTMMVLTPTMALAQSPFQTGSNALSSDVLAIAAPIAGIALIAVGVAAWFNKISWWWMAGVVIGIVLVFGNTQIVTWIRGLFGV